MNGWNPRFVAYAQSRGLTAEAELQALSAIHPGDPPRFHEFMNWVHARWAEWRRLHNRHPEDPIGPEDHRAFDLWLAR